MPEGEPDLGRLGTTKEVPDKKESSSISHYDRIGAEMERSASLWRRVIEPLVNKARSDMRDLLGKVNKK